MDYKKYSGPAFNIYTIKTERFKTTHMEIVFRSKACKEKMTASAFLVDMLCESTKDYPSRRLFITKMEELYRASFYGTTIRTGNLLNTNFILDFINPEYIDDKNYLENVLSLPFQALCYPNVINNEFDLKTFKVVKERIKKDIESIKENPFKLSVRNAIDFAHFNTPTSYPLLGTLEDLESITPSSLYDSYTELFNNSTCDIFIIGNVDMDEAVSIIKKHFIYRYINDSNLKLLIDNKWVKKPLVGSNESNNIQANLVMFYNLIDLTKNERDVVFQVFNYIFGNGGLTCKLYQNIREKNSLCYGVNSMYLKYDNLLLIHVSLDNVNIDKAISLIKKSLIEMQNGDFKDEDLEDAKKNLCVSLDVTSDNNVAILSNYVFEVYDELPRLDKRKDLYKNVTKKDIINLSKKIKLNTIYTLEGGTEK